MMTAVMPEWGMNHAALDNFLLSQLSGFFRKFE